MLRSITELYSFALPYALVARLRQLQNSPVALLRWFWQAKSYAAQNTGQQTAKSRIAVLILSAGMLAQIVVGIGFLVEWARYGTTGAWEFGAALIVSYPIVWAHVLALGASIPRLVYFVDNPKKLGRAIVCNKLEYQVKQLRKRHDFTVVAVTGSVGKTSTKLAIAELLGQSKRVRYQTGNYNDRVTVPLVFFGATEPNILNMLAWFKIFRTNARQITGDFPYDIVVVELGTDKPGDIAEFAYIKPDIAVITAVSPEHMEFFGTIDAVAAEELAVFDFAGQVLVNGDDIAGKYLAGNTFKEYSLKSRQADYYAVGKVDGLKGQKLTVTSKSGKLEAAVGYIGVQGAKFGLAAAAVADIVGVSKADVAKGLPKLQPFSGRMQILPGIKDSTLIDDTYNASPLAVCAALDVLYAAKTTQRIAILGGMNELGDYSEQAHIEVGTYCNPNKLNLVVTIGRDAEKWLAPAAKKAGCTVVSFKSPYEAGDYAKSKLKKGAVALAKGSQNGVFAEEALKILLADADDMTKLVRQSSYWMAKKEQQFGKPTGKKSETIVNKVT